MLSDFYRSYTYAYPHKRAYRELDPPVDLASLWAQEARDNLFLYLHLPFCEMRCGFCNLFTTSQPEPELRAAYLERLTMQARALAPCLSPARFAGMALGGGTPTLLTPAELEQVLAVCRDLGADPRNIPCSVEASPATISAERMELLRQLGVSRLSLGVQTFSEEESRALGRSQSSRSVELALETLRAVDFPVLNLDLIYGIPGQSAASWLDSLRRAVSYQPQELFLYPLYIRPLMGLAEGPPPPRGGGGGPAGVLALGSPEGGNGWGGGNEERLALYRLGRDFLLASGYEQLSMRSFAVPLQASEQGPAFCVQRDGTVGLGCGARSYTRRLHYADPYAVTRPAVRDILRQWCQRTPESFQQASFGFRLDAQEERSRMLIYTLLQMPGTDLEEYRARFASSPQDDFPQLLPFVQRGWMAEAGGRLYLTCAGLEASDLIGPALISARVEELAACAAAL